VRVTAETMDPAWWRSELGAVAFVLVHHPEGCSTVEGLRSGVEVGRGDALEVARVRVVMPEMVIVQIPGVRQSVVALATGRTVVFKGKERPVVRVGDAAAVGLRKGLGEG
jgi:hypothetical protein